MMISDFRLEIELPRDSRSSSMTCRAMSAYFELSSMPKEFRPLLNAATRVDPVPAIGSRTVCPFLVKNSMNSCAIVSGNLAGWRSTPFLRGGGLWMNQDFWNFSQVLESRSLSLLGMIFSKLWSRSRGACRLRCLGGGRCGRRAGVHHLAHHQVGERDVDILLSARTGEESERAFAEQRISKL